MWMLPIRNPALEGGGCSAPSFGDFGKYSEPIRWSSGPVWTSRKISPPRGFDPWTAEPDFAILELCTYTYLILSYNRIIDMACREMSCATWKS